MNFKISILAAAALGSAVHAQQQNFDKVEVHVLPVQGNIYMLVGAGGNITMQAGKDGVLLVDTMYAALNEKVVAAIRTINKGPIRYIINTHMHADHTDGNEKMAKLGATIAGGNVMQLSDAAVGAAVIAHENVLNRMTAQKPTLPFGMLPTDTYFTNKKEVFFNGEAVQILYQGNAHTDGDSMVFFRRSDVVSTGDVFTPGNYPIIDLDHGGSFNGLIASLNRIIDLTVPAEKQEGGTYVIPGHGRLCDEADVVEYRDMATIIRDRIQDMVKKGMTLEQVKEARPTRDYDPLYGSTTGFWTTDKFVEAAYKSLSQSAKK
jgi:glyoxylase-like metal-dependent hydrolase (beta-lactamase superfamily II)